METEFEIFLDFDPVFPGWPVEDETAQDGPRLHGYSYPVHPADKVMVMSETASLVPHELMQELHRALDHFHERKEAHEKVMGGSEYRHEERLDEAVQQFRQAEADVEAIAERITHLLEGRSK